VSARLVPRKGHADLLAAMPALVRRVPDVLVLAAGGGPLGHVLPALAEASGLAGHVRFLGHRADVPDLLAASDVVVLPSRVEGLPLAVLEALAAGRPVVATRVGGVAEAVDDGVTGRLVPPRAPAELAAAVGELLTDDGRRAAMALAARTVAEARFGADGATRRLEAAYDRWLEEMGQPVDGEDGAPAEAGTGATTAADARSGR
jgi:glycosyltransferase involved in cell wall biosynthesis